MDLENLLDSMVQEQENQMGRKMLEDEVFEMERLNKVEIEMLMR